MWLLLVIVGMALDKESGSGAEARSVYENQQEKDTVKEYKIGETQTVDGQWRLTVNSVKETEDRNQFIEMRHNKIRRKHKRNTRGTAEKDMSVTMRDGHM